MCVCVCVCALCFVLLCARMCVYVYREQNLLDRKAEVSHHCLIWSEICAYCASQRSAPLETRWTDCRRLRPSSNPHQTAVAVAAAVACAMQPQTDLKRRAYLGQRRREREARSWQETPFQLKKRKEKKKECQAYEPLSNSDLEMKRRQSTRVLCLGCFGAESSSRRWVE